MSSKRFVLYFMMLLVLFMSFFFISNDIRFYPIGESDDKSFILYFSIIIAIIVIFIIALLILKKVKPSAYNRFMSLFLEEEEDFNGDKYIEDLRNKIILGYSNSQTKKSENKKSADILELMLDNMKEIRDYYVISKKQARNAFSLAVSLCITGVILIILSVILALAFDVSVAISIIPAIGGAISELIAGTALMVYKASLIQLKNYYDSLHNNERFLSLVNLVSKLSASKQDEVYADIINIELQKL